MSTIELDHIQDMQYIDMSPLIKIETEDGTIEIPPTKQIFTRRGWVKAQDLTEKDEILAFS